MQELSTLLSPGWIAGAIATVVGGLATALKILWSKLGASEERERALYRELVKDSEVLKEIADQRRDHTELLGKIDSRLESLERFLAARHSAPAGPNN